MDEFFFTTFLDSIPMMDMGQQMRLRTRIREAFPSLLEPIRSDGERPMLVGTPVPPPPSTTPLGKALQFKVGDRVMITGDISPAYLKGQQGTVQRKNGSTIGGRTKWRINVKLDNKVGRFDNAYPIGVPVECLTKVPV